MCGRYTVLTDEENLELAKLVESLDPGAQPLGAPDQIQLGEVFPSESAPIVVARDGQAACVPMSWGFPRWKGPGVIINARCETAAELNMFRDAVRSRRCLVPCSGFFEWQRSDTGARTKKRHYITLAGQKTMYMAGLYGEFGTDPHAPARFVVITQPANEQVAPIHNRMPLILPHKGLRKAWMLDDQLALELLHHPPEVSLCVRAE